MNGVIITAKSLFIRTPKLQTLIGVSVSKGELSVVVSKEILLTNDDMRLLERQVSELQIICLPFENRQKTFSEKVRDLFRTVYV
ncbi:MAG: hypothetical protein PHI66_04405 [Candidatus Pacebacteria bacterium]|nr:hypothetical protein [Candidatus Paceibacterota bacterium]